MGRWRSTYPTGQIRVCPDLSGHIGGGVAIQIRLHEARRRRQGGCLRQERGHLSQTGECGRRWWVAALIGIDGRGCCRWRGRPSSSSSSCYSRCSSSGRLCRRLCVRCWNWFGAAQRNGRKSKRKVDFLLIEMTILGFDFAKAHVTYMALPMRIFRFGLSEGWKLQRHCECRLIGH